MNIQHTAMRLNGPIVSVFTEINDVTIIGTQSS